MHSVLRTRSGTGLPDLDLLISPLLANGNVAGFGSEGPGQGKATSLSGGLPASAAGAGGAAAAGAAQHQQQQRQQSQPGDASVQGAGDSTSYTGGPSPGAVMAGSFYTTAGAGGKAWHPQSILKPIPLKRLLIIALPSATEGCYLHARNRPWGLIRCVLMHLGSGERPVAASVQTPHPKAHLWAHPLFEYALQGMETGPIIPPCVRPWGRPRRFQHKCNRSLVLRMPGIQVLGPVRTQAAMAISAVGALVSFRGLHRSQFLPMFR